MLIESQIFNCSNVPMFQFSNVTMCFSFHRVKRVSCPLVHWTIGLLVHWSFGPLVHWSIDPLVHWSIGPLVHWSIGPLAHWSIGPLVHWLRLNFCRSVPPEFLRSFLIQYSNTSLSPRYNLNRMMEFLVSQFSFQLLPICSFENFQGHDVLTVQWQNDIKSEHSLL